MFNVKSKAKYDRQRSIDRQTDRSTDIYTNHVVVNESIKSYNMIMFTYLDCSILGCLLVKLLDDQVRVFNVHIQSKML